uniref:Uncharacterized protein n=1 Tax=Zooxanthella nutricula TaxID=1333877 RepID=A0A6U6GCY4_9DINO|mmetsp:Transcript_100839/g.308302  ORF Transcript_100839/g.308302 Transcript_100839/m.308302 type:complete len:283 (+) Transcript_100839:84-932(+)
MLRIQKNTLVTDLSKSQVEIRQLEIDWYSNNYATITSQAMMLAGFAFAQLTTPMPEDYPSPLLLELSYLGLTSSCIGFELCAIIASNFLSTWAPSLALRGKTGVLDLHRAVDAMRDYQVIAFGLFIAGWLLFFLSSIFQLWIYFPRNVALVMTFPMTGFGLATMYFLDSLTRQLWLSDSEAVSGRVGHFHAYEHIADLDDAMITERGGGPIAKNIEGGVTGLCPLHEELPDMEAFVPRKAAEREADDLASERSTDRASWRAPARAALGYSPSDSRELSRRWH